MTGRWWETFVPLKRCFCCKQNEKVWVTVQKYVIPKMIELEECGVVFRWCFLIHNKESGVPTASNKLFVHIRAELTPDVSHGRFVNFLGPRFYMTRRIVEGKMDQIAGLNLDRITGREEEAWSLLCTQTQFAVKLLGAYKKTPKAREIGQWLHYFSNMFLMEVK